MYLGLHIHSLLCPNGAVSRRRNGRAHAQADPAWLHQPAADGPAGADVERDAGDVAGGGGEIVAEGRR